MILAVKRHAEDDSCKKKKMSSNLTVKRVCEYCGKLFNAKTTVTRFCSTRCNGRSGKERIKALKIAGSEMEVREKLTSPSSLLVTEFLTVIQTAKLLNMHPNTVYSIIRCGKLRAVQLSPRKVIIKRTDIDKLFELPEIPIKPVVKSKRAPHPRYCYTMAQAQEIFKFSEKAMYDLIKRNNIPKYQKGWYTYVLKSDLNRIMNQK